MAGLINLLLAALILAIAGASAYWFLILLPKERFADFSDSRCKYDQSMTGSSNRVVLYWAPWCPHCTDFKPVFQQAADAAAREGLDVAFLSVNSDKQDPTANCLSFKGVSSFPTVLLEKGGAAPPYAAYNGPRTADALLAWVRASI